MLLLLLFSIILTATVSGLICWWEH